ncbi:hypothetical protein GCM10009554_42890 [Kribbella koreensis]|uniref:DUF4279 domain-containing protein n=1 Tax=Kribbella koreensis TaxID=57909 RepID=A0ABN1QSG8_9ACTN
MIRAEIVVQSAELSLDELTAIIGREPDSGRTIGSPSRVQPSRNYRSSLWAQSLEWDSSLHGGTEGLSIAVAALGDELGGRLAALKLQGCDVVLDVVQDIEGEHDDSTLGLSFSEAAVEWLARAKASISVDQYVGTAP